MMHTANMVDVAYERGMGWLKVILFSTISSFVMTAIAFYTGWNLWESTGNWLKVAFFSITTAFVISAIEYYSDWNLWENTGNWLKDKLASWSDSIFD